MNSDFMEFMDAEAPRATDHTLARLRGLIAHRTEALPELKRAQAYIGSADEQADIEEVLSTLDRFICGDSGDKAIAIVAVAQRIGRRISGPRVVVEEFGKIEADLAALRRALPPEHVLQGEE